jgi:hypothetical protein
MLGVARSLRRPSRASTAMSTTELLEALERELETAKENHLAIVATQELGGVKREVRALLDGTVTLRDLFPRRLFREAHTATDDLLDALGKARTRVLLEAEHARERAITARRLVERARRLEEAKERKATSKTEARVLLTASYSAIYERHVSWMRRRFRADHTPSRVLVPALREALASVVGGPQGGAAPAAGPLRDLLSMLDPLTVRTELKAEINAFLDGSEHGRIDLRPRRWVRADHAPTAAFVELLEALIAEYDALANGRVLEEKLAVIDGLVARLTKRSALKTSRDACLEKAKALKRSLAQSRAHARAMAAQIEEELAAFEHQAADLRRRIALAAEAEWRAQRDLEDDQAARERIVSLLEWLEDEPPLPDDVAAATVRERALRLAVAGANLDGENAAVRAERERLRSALEGERALEARERLELEQALDEARANLDRAARARAVAEAELLILTAVVGSPLARDDFDGVITAELSRAIARAQDQQRSAETAIARSQATLAARSDALLALVNELSKLETSIHEAVLVRMHCLDRIEQAERAIARYDELKSAYRKTDALCLYITSSQDFSETLLSVASLLKGRRNSVDAMGGVRIAILIDAGVRAGADLGFATLAAEVRLTVLVEGALAVLDSREVMFESRLGVFLSAGAKASINVTGAVESAAEALGVGDILPVPELLIEASAKCKASLYDERSCTLYADENHWALRWSHAIARRIAFLRSVRITRRGFESIDEAWLDAQLTELSKSGGALSHIKSLRAALDAAPRTLTLATGQRLEGSATAALGSLSRTVGSDGNYGRFLLREGSGPELTLEEHALDTEPEDDDASNTATSALYHRLVGVGPSPRGAESLRAFIEVRRIASHQLALGKLKLTSASTSSRSLGGTGPEMHKRYRALAGSLDAEPNADFALEVSLPDAFMTDVRGPSTASASSASGTSVAADVALARAMRMRLDLVASRGEPHAMTRLLNRVKSFEEDIERRLETARDKAGEAARISAQLAEVLASKEARAAASSQLASSTLATFRSPLARASRMASEASEVARSIEERASLLDESLKEKVAELKECITLLENSHAVYARYVRSWRCKLGPSGAALVWEPAWVAQLHRGICRRTFEFEAEVSYDVVPLVKVFLGGAVRVESEAAEFEALGLSTLSYLKSLATRMSDDVAAAWWALHMAEIFDICSRVAEPGSVAFSEVVLDALEGRPEVRAPARAFGEACWRVFRTDDNPFAAKGFGEAAIVAAMKPRAIATASASKPAIAPTPEALAAEAALTEAYLLPLHERLKARWSEGAMGERPRTFLALLRGIGGAMTRSKHLKDTLVKKYTGNLERSIRSEAEHLERIAGLTETWKAVERDITEKATTVTDKGGNRYAKARALSALLSQKLKHGATLEASLMLGLTDLRRGSLLGEGSGPAALVFEAAAYAHAALLVPTTIPRADAWKRSSSVSFMLRSGATDILDRAVEAFHTAQKPAPRFEARVFGGVGAAVDVAMPLLQALVTRLDALETLQAAIATWYGDREESASRRAPYVAALLEVPIAEEWRRLGYALALCVLRIEMASTLEAHLLIEAGITAVEARAAKAITRFRDLKRRASEPTPLEELKRLLLAYLRVASDDFRHDAVVHGKKKTHLRGNISS